MIGIASTHPVIKHRKSMEILQKNRCQFPLQPLKKGYFSAALGCQSHVFFGVAFWSSYWLIEPAVDRF